MTNDRKRQQARLDALFLMAKQMQLDAPYARVCAYAKQGQLLPESLRLEEIKEVCTALVICYAQMGIE